MNRKTDNKSFFIWLNEIWEEMEVQFYGITGATFFFVLLYLIFHPPWMTSMIDFFYNFISSE